MFSCCFFTKERCVACFFFFFQAEDGIRDIGVTGVQTCALPISGLDGVCRFDFLCASPVVLFRFGLFNPFYPLAPSCHKNTCCPRNSAPRKTRLFGARAPTWTRGERPSRRKSLSGAESAPINGWRAKTQTIF